VLDGIAGDADRAVVDFKIYASRALTARGFEDAARKRWARGGSTRALVNERVVREAVRYVVSGQGEAMAVWSAAEAESPR